MKVENENYKNVKLENVLFTVSEVYIKLLNKTMYSNYCTE